MPETENILRISLLQLETAWEDKARNLAAIEDKVLRLAGETDLVILPEMFSTGFSMNTEKLAESMEGPAVCWMLGLSDRLGAALAGSLIIREGKDYFNRLVWTAPGKPPVYYDKRHLFRMGKEDTHYTAGRQRLNARWKGWEILPLVCYDLRFPVWSRNRQDYDLLVYVANWPAARREVWLKLLQARAIENQSYVAAVNRVGKDGRDIHYAGDSVVVDPRGQIMASTKPHVEDVLMVHLDLQELRSFREKFPVHLDADNFEILP